MFNVTAVLPHNLLQTNTCIRHNFSTQVFRKRAAQLHYVGPELLVPNEEHVQCDHRFASPLANEPLHTSQLFDTSLQKAHATTSLCSCTTFSGLQRPENVAQLRAHIVKLCRALSEDLCRNVVTNARVRLQEVVRQNGGHIEHVLHYEQFSSL